MSWIKVFAHDIRCGLLRWRYLLAPGLVILECFYLGDEAVFRGIGPSLADMVLYIFRGKEPIVGLDIGNAGELPLPWLLVMGGILLLNLDYMLYDLTNAGQQVILRSRSRTGWFLGKCLWNLMSTALCFCVMLLTAAAAALCFGGELSLLNHPDLSYCLFGPFAEGEIMLTRAQTLMAGLLAPFLTIAALSMLQMTLCLFMKPVFSFLICEAQLILALFWKSPFCLGEGAMVMRSAWVATDYYGPEYAGVSTNVSAVFALAVLIVCVAAGTVRFRHTDILGLEE